MRLWNIIRKITAILVLSILFVSVPASANEQVSGKISRVFLSGAYNYAFRVDLMNNGADALTSCNASFAFLNINDDNYQAKVSTLLSAQAQRQNVTLVISKDAANFCRIVEFYVVTG